MPSVIRDSVNQTTDAFLGGALMLRQPARGYRAGIDPVLLAASCPAEVGQRVIDCGAGIGTVGLCVARRVSKLNVTLVEREAGYLDFARANVKANALEDRVTVVAADLTKPVSQSQELIGILGRFDHALANPPFMGETAGTRAPDPLKDAAMVMPDDALTAWVRFMAAMVRPGGTATLIHRADALYKLLQAMDRRFGGMRIRMIHPRADAPANRVLITGSKGSRAALSFLPPLVVHGADGSYLPAVEAVLRAPAALS